VALASKPLGRGAAPAWGEAGAIDDRCRIPNHMLCCCAAEAVGAFSATASVGETGLALLKGSLAMAVLQTEVASRTASGRSNTRWSGPHLDKVPGSASAGEDFALASPCGRCAAAAQLCR